MASHSYAARSGDLNQRVEALYHEGLNSQQISKRTGLSVGSVANRINNLGLPPRPAKRIRTEKKPEFMPKEIPAPVLFKPSRPVTIPSYRPMTATERVNMERRRKSLIREMGGSPTDEQRLELASIVNALDVDYCARQAQRVAA